MDTAKKRIIYFGAIIAALIYIFAGNRLNYKKIHLEGAAGGGTTISGVVTEVSGKEIYSTEAYLHEGEATNFTARTKNGEVKAVQYADVYDQVDYKTVEVGDRVVLNSYMEDSYTFAGYNFGHYVMPLYTIAARDPKSGEYVFSYIHRLWLSTDAQVDAFHEGAMRAIFAGIENPEKTVGEIMEEI